jgi:hypothetical protein
MAIDLDDPVALLLASAAAFARVGIEAAAYGGLTLGMYGEPRETRDADLAVVGVAADTAREALLSLGVTVVVAFTDVRFGGCTVTRLSLVGGGQLNTVDLVTPRSRRYAEAMMARALTGTLRGESIRVVSGEDFIILKTLATRARDLEDARSVVDKQGPRLDPRLMREEIETLATEIADHDIRERFATLMS